MLLLLFRAEEIEEILSTNAFMQELQNQIGITPHSISMISLLSVIVFCVIATYFSYLGYSNGSCVVPRVPFLKIVYHSEFAC